MSKRQGMEEGDGGGKRTAKERIKENKEDTRLVGLHVRGSSSNKVP